MRRRFRGAFEKGNVEAIEIEIYYSKSDDKRYEDVEKNTVEYAEHVLVQLGLSASAVKFHQEWNEKNCLHRILDEKRLATLKKAVANRVEELKRQKNLSQSISKPLASKEKLYYEFHVDSIG